MKGAESILFESTGTLHVMTEEAKLLSLTDLADTRKAHSIPAVTAKATEIMDLGSGRPLGGKFARDGTLYIADAILGLNRVRFEKNVIPQLEHVASEIIVDGNKYPIHYVNDLDIGPKTGLVYFTSCKFRFVLYFITL